MFATSLLAAGDNTFEQLHRLEVEALLLPVLIQLVIILLAARVFAVLFRKLGQPAVVGEIAAGLVLGPSLLGYFFPAISAAIFKPAIGDLPHELSDELLNKVFTVLSQIGLIFLLFLVGLEFDFSHLRWHGKAALAISIVGVALPFGLGAGLAPLLWPHIEAHPATGQPVPLLGFLLFLGLALSITAIPILGRMMMELGITRTRLGAITISAAAVDDATGWILLATVATIVRTGYAEFPLWMMLAMAAQTVGFLLAMIFVARPLLVRWVRRLQERGGGKALGLNSLAVLLSIVLLCALATNVIGIFSIFGAFILGAALSDETEFRKEVSARLGDLVTVFFLPIFFTYTGLRTNIGTLNTPLLWLFCGLVLAASVVGKLAGCGLAARLTGFSRRESICIGLMMNTRALMGLIAINLGYELRVIPPSVFCMLVIMALVTTVMTTPALLRAMPGTELEPYIRRSGFLGKADTILASGSPAKDIPPAESVVPELPAEQASPSAD